MKSDNFEMLRGKWPELASLGAFAESYAHADPASALVKLRLFAENLTKDIYRDLGLPKPDQPAFVDLLTNQSFSAITPKVVLDRSRGSNRRKILRHASRLGSREKGDDPIMGKT
jgi:type I restriction enzyme R subunit